MRKLKLTLEDLEVTSFRASDIAQDRGTVVAHKPPAPTSFRCEETVLGVWTCDYTCADSCQQFCGTMQTQCGSCDSI